MLNHRPRVDGSSALPRKILMWPCRQGSKRSYNNYLLPSYAFTLSYRHETLDSIGRCDDGCEESIIFPRVAKATIVEKLGKLGAIDWFTVQVALKYGTDTGKFTFFETRTARRAILQLAVGKLVLVNVTLLVADGDLPEQENLIRESVSKHFQADTRALFEKNPTLIYGAHCCTVRALQKDSRHGNVSALMTSGRTVFTRPILQAGTMWRLIVQVWTCTGHG